MIIGDTIQFKLNRDWYMVPIIESELPLLNIKSAQLNLFGPNILYEGFLEKWEYDSPFFEIKVNKIIELNEKRTQTELNWVKIEVLKECVEFQ